MSNRSIWHSTFVTMWLAVAGCGGPLIPPPNGPFPTGEAIMPSDGPDSRFNPLSAEESRVILGKGTERALAHGGKLVLGEILKSTLRNSFVTSFRL